MPEMKSDHPSLELTEPIEVLLVQKITEKVQLPILKEGSLFVFKEEATEHCPQSMEIYEAVRMSYTGVKRCLRCVYIKDLE